MEPQDVLLKDETRDLLETLARDLAAVSESGPEGAALFTLEAVEDIERENLGLHSRRDPSRLSAGA